jgi:hypothetical protein
MKIRSKAISGAVLCIRRIPASARASRLGCVLLWSALWLPSPALSQTILDAFYDRAQDALIVDLAYQGTNPNHDFSLVWDACQPAGEGKHAVVGRLIDNQGNDAAKSDFQVRRRFPLTGLGCRPAEVTVRMGPVSNRSVSVPAQGR